MKKIITILGSTGSVGSQAVDLIARNLDKCKVHAIIANNNIEVLIKQAKMLQPELVVVQEKDSCIMLKEALKSMRIRVESGEDVIISAVQDSDLVISAIVGIAGLRYTFAAIKSDALVAIANKESLVCGGELLSVKEIQRIIPLDSEHSAIYRMWNKDIKKIILTASGGPFYNNNKERSLKEALKHPSWSMGKKISIDSATMLNKVLEVIEAHYLFALDKKNIEILVHPESVVHGIIVNRDGSNTAFLSKPNMQTCIAHALSLTFGESIEFNDSLDLTKIAKLTFFNPDYNEFPVLSFLNSDQHITISVANEVAVSAFLQDKIAFNDIYKVIAKTLDSFHYSSVSSIEEVLAIDTSIRDRALNFIKSL